MSPQPFETATLHFDLGYAEGFDGFTLHTGDGSHRLAPHTAETRARFARENRALAALVPERLEELSHYAEGVALPSDVARMVWVTADPQAGHEGYLRPLMGVKIHIPVAVRREVRRRRFRLDGELRHATLRHLGVSAGETDEEALLDLHAHADTISVTPLDVARTLTFYHPQLTSRDPETAAVVMDDHVDETADLLAFATFISSLGPATETGGWATIAPSVNKDGEVMTWGPGWEEEGHPEGSPVLHYRLSDKLAGGAHEGPADIAGPGAVREALRTSQDDAELEGRKWSVLQGSPDVRRGAPEAAEALAAKLAAAPGTGYGFTLDNRTPGFGLDVPQGSIAFDEEGGRFGVDADNVFLRTLSVYVRFLDVDGEPIADPPGWEDRLPELLREIFESDTKKYVTEVTAVNVVLGIPMPTDPTRVDFPWPEEAASCEILFGGIGTRDWDDVVVPAGMILTGVFQYGIPLLFMIGGAAITSTKWYRAFLENRDLVAAVLGVGFGAVGGGVATAAALLNTKTVLFAFGDAVAGILVSKGLEKLSLYVVARIAASQMASAAPFVGWGFRIANMAITAVNLAETTIEVLISPCTYTVEVRRELGLRVTVRPDPLHGTDRQPAVWPDVASHYVATVQYRNGTNYTVTGDLPAERSKRDEPVVVSFPDLPTGGEMQVVFGVYSDTDWLAGTWTSAWTRAVLPKGGEILELAGAIRENLVPLTPRTQYLYREKLTYDRQQGAHVWRRGDQPTAVVSDLDGGSEGHNLARLVNLSINDKASMLGYCWQASGQDLPLCGAEDRISGQIFSFQNISSLADPGAALKFPSCGFSAQPYLVYDQFGPAPLFSLDGKLEESLDRGKVTDELREAFGLNARPLPGEARVEVLEESVRWLLSAAGEPTYDLEREADGRIDVYDHPTHRISQNNFYVDTRSKPYHLRKVVLDDETPFDMDPEVSYGCFNQPHLDSVVIHPAGFAIGVSWTNSKMEILQIPAEGVPDAKAQPASLVSGKGLRQGLMNGPRALAVTADGRILVLESTNRRIQAFDIHGNAVASFVGDRVTTLPAAEFAAQLDGGLVTLPLRERFERGGAALTPHWRVVQGADQADLRLRPDGRLGVQWNGADPSNRWTITDAGAGTAAPVYEVEVEGDGLRVSVGGQPRFALPLGDRTTLDRGVVDPTIVEAFAQHDLELSPQARVEGDRLAVPGSQMEALARGVVPDGLRAALRERGVTLTEAAAVRSLVTVRVEVRGSLWVLEDGDAARSYRVTVDPEEPGRLLATEYNPFMPLHRDDPDEDFTYLDMGAEMKGYLYVLGYTGRGERVEDYKLDLYDPTGRWLSRTPNTEIHPQATGVNGAKLVVDLWRTLFTLAFEHFEGPGGRTEPAVCRWLPTPPEGTGG